MYQVLLLLAELFLIAFATAAAIFLIDNFEVSEASMAVFAPHLLCTLATATIILLALRTYRSVWRFTGMADYLRILAATCAIVASSAVLGSSFRHSNAPALLALQGLLILFLLVGVRTLARLSFAARERLTHRKAAREAPSDETVLVIGVGGLADLYLRFLTQFEPQQIRIVGLLGDTRCVVGRCVHGHPILGTLEQIEEALRRLEIHGVVVERIVLTTKFDQLSPQARAALLGIEKTKKIKLAFLADEIGRGRQSHGNLGSSSGGSPKSVEEFSLNAEDLAALTSRPYWRVKRALEPVAALGLLIVLLPLFLIVAILTVIDVGLPVTFWQLRPGLNGRQFKLHKFRTMANACDVGGRELAEDERTSAIGHCLRRARLDELPQLFSILSGEMSFIGPRPLLPVDQPAAFSARLLVRPGLTGWAQVKGGRAISAADKAALDVWYVRNSSLALDLKILVYTLPMVIVGEKVDASAIHQAWRELREAGICTSRQCGSEQSEPVASVASLDPTWVEQARAVR